MRLILDKSYLYQFLFFLCIGVSYLDNFELTYAVWSLVFLLTLKKSYSLKIIQYISYFVIILLIGIVVLLFKEYKTYYIFRDFTYMTKPIIGFFVGYQICKNNFNQTFKTLVYTGFLIALIHLGALASGIIFDNARSVNDLRYAGGYFSDFEIYALILLLFHDKFEIGLTTKRLRLLTLIIGFSSFMYLARTNFIQFVILFVAMKGYFKINKTSIMVVSSLITFVIIGYSTILYINPKRNGPGIEALLYKIKIAPNEAFKTKIDRDDWKDFNDNYRSYENITTVKQISRSGILSVLFGEGLGSKIDLKQELQLGDMKLRYISILHNGFMTVFLKSGLLGIAIYLYSIYLLFKQKKSKIPIIQNINLLLVGTGVFLIFSNWVFMGVYNKLDNKSILIGLLFCYIEMKNQKNLSTPELNQE